MDPWYEVSGPSEPEVEQSMNRSDVYLCLYKETNTEKENSYLRQVVMNIINKERERSGTPLPYHENDAFQTIKYESIRRHPDWKKLSATILREEVIAHKPYGSWRGFSTFVIAPLREKFIIRIIREIWAPYVLQTKFLPKWHDYNYSPHSGAEGYLRTKEHYNKIKINN